MANIDRIGICKKRTVKIKIAANFKKMDTSMIGIIIFLKKID